MQHSRPWRGRTGSLDALHLIDHGISAPEDGFQLREALKDRDPVGIIGHPFKLTDDHIVDLISIKDRWVSFVEKLVDVLLTLVDGVVSAGPGALLSHMPVPPEYGGQPGVPTDTPAPLIQGSGPFKEYAPGRRMGTKPEHHLQVF